MFFLRQMLILSSHLWLGLSCGFSCFDLLSKVLYAVLISPISATYHKQLMFIDLVTIIVISVEKSKQLKSSLCCSLHAHVYSA